MALNGYLPSSRPYYITFGNPQSDRSPYITIKKSSSYSADSGCYISFTDRNGGNYTLTITGTNGGSITTNTFNSSTDNGNQPIISLAEALKKNISMFYDVKVTHSGTEYVVTAYYDSSTKYTVAYGNSLSVTGDLNGIYNPMVKYTLNYDVNDGETMFDCEKYTNDKSVDMNIVAPFTTSIGKYPIKFTITGFKSYDDSEGVSHSDWLRTNATYDVLPTTFGEFTEPNYTEFIVYTGNSMKGKFLTNNQRREIGYDEPIALSVLNDSPSTLYFTMKFYSPSGTYITSVTEGDKNLTYWSETVNNRTDIYVTPPIDYVETSTGKTVGYIECVVTNGTEEVTEPLTLVVNGRCQTANTLYFVNKIGGVDWYTFRGTTETEIDIDDSETYSSLLNSDGNSHKTFGKTNVAYKTMDKKITLNSGKITHATAKWLDELTSSKYAFIIRDGYFYEIVIDEIDITIDTSERYSECSVTYYVGDKDLH